MYVISLFLLLIVVLLLVLIFRKPRTTTTPTTPTTPTNWNEIFRKIGIATGIVLVLFLIVCTGIFLYNSSDGTPSQSLRLRDNNGVIQQNQIITVVNPVTERVVIKPTKPQKVETRYIEETEQTVRKMQQVGNKKWTDPNSGPNPCSIVVTNGAYNGLR